MYVMLLCSWLDDGMLLRAEGQPFHSDAIMQEILTQIVLEAKHSQGAPSHLAWHKHS